MKPEEKPAREEKLIRILSTDVPGSKKLYIGLTRIKGVSFAFSNALCYTLKIDKNKKVAELSEDEIKKVSEFIKNPQDLPDYLLNRRKDIETGKTRHLSLSDLDMQKEFDIKRLKKIRSYRGLRHAFGQPVRGQRTKSHFRKRDKKKAVGVQSKKPAGAGAKK
jgi:small subunit ribosomal protein S13